MAPVRPDVPIRTGDLSRDVALAIERAFRSGIWLGLTLGAMIGIAVGVLVKQ